MTHNAASHIDTSVRPSSNRPSKTTQLMAAVACLGVGAIGGAIYELKNTADVQAKLDNAHRVYAQKTVERDATIKRLQAKIAKLTQPAGQRPMFEPATALKPEQEAMCLALAMYGEVRGELQSKWPAMAQAIVRRATDERSTGKWHPIYKPSVCAAIIAPEQYSSMTNRYHGLVKKVVWGDLRVNPFTSKTGKADKEAWNAILPIARGTMAGEYPVLTMADHFWSPKAANKIPKFAKALMPLEVVGQHILYTDNILMGGKRVVFTADNKYDPRKHKADAPEVNIFPESVPSEYVLVGNQMVHQNKLEDYLKQVDK